MALDKNWFANLRGAENLTGEARQRMLEILARCYVRESQHVMRLRQHAERIAHAQTREALLRIATEDAEHARWIAEKIAALGGELPALTAIHPSHENAWEYLRSDLDEERRSMAEIEDDKENLQSDFPDVLALLDRIESDAESHWKELRALLLRRDELVALAV